MTAIPLRSRVAAATAGVAVAVSTIAVGSAAQAEPSRTAATSADTTYLSDALGLPTDTVVETVTYDRFQWLLQQQGQFAFVVGSTQDEGFKAKIIQADAAAKAAGASKIYWYDPNLSGYVDDRNLDTRNPAGINLAAATQTTYGNTWKNLLGQYLGNGIKSTPNGTATTVAITADDTVINDSVDPIWDYRTTKTAAVTTTDDIFFVYDKDHQAADAADKIVDWVNLSTTSAENTPAEIAAAISAIGGGAAIDQLSQFAWWKSAANHKHDLSYPDDARYGGDIIADSDDDAGWRIQQVTYPALLHLLNDTSAGANYALLFGGTWCHNTRAVLKQVNKEAQATGVTTVYNFDFVLDGGNTNGSNGSGNALHIRDNRNSGATIDFRPSYLYGDVVNTYFPNVVTELAGVSYSPGGDLAATAGTALKGQVPFLLHYERGTGAAPSAEAVKSQWIKSLGAGKYKEYMTEWWFTLPADQLGLNFAIPEDESTLTSAQQGQLNTARTVGLAFGQEAVAKLTEFFEALPVLYSAEAAVSSPEVQFGTDASITLTVPTTEGHAPSGTATLTINGATYAKSVAGNSATFAVPGLAVGSHDYTVAYASDPYIQAFTLPGSVSVGKAAVAAAGAVVSAPTPQKSGTYKVTVGQPAGLPDATGTVTVTLTSGSATQKVTGTLVDGSATVTVPKLAAGTWKASVAYAGNANYAAKTVAGASVVSAKTAVSKVAGKVTTKPTTTKAGSYTITVSQPTGLAKATGKVTVTLTKGSVSKKVTGTLKAGTVKVTVPKLAAGTWKASVAYAGDANYAAKTAAGASVVAAKTAVSKTTKVTKTPTTRATGAYKVTVVQPKGLAKATGKVTVILKKGKVTKKVTGTLKSGAVTVKVPKLSKGTWKVTVSYAGNATYLAKSSAGKAIVVRK